MFGILEGEKSYEPPLKTRIIFHSSTAPARLFKVCHRMSLSIVLIPLFPHFTPLLSVALCRSQTVIPNLVGTLKYDRSEYESGAVPYNQWRI